jgi:hypothetical protein
MTTDALLPGRRVRVYRNLHSGNFSVQCTKSGLVVARVSRIVLANAAFVVRPAGRAKVLAQKKKNVHAFVVGEVSAEALAGTRQVKYNPYAAGHFWINSPEQEISRANLVLLVDNKIFIRKESNEQQ